MFVNDPIADMLARIRNAAERGKESVSVPASKMLRQVAAILQEEGFVAGVTEIEAKPQNQLEIVLRYDEQQKPAVRGSKRVSKPGVRQYIGYRDIRKIKNGLGISIISTSKGIMSGDKARQQQLGGEVVCYIW